MLEKSKAYGVKNAKFTHKNTGCCWCLDAVFQRFRGVQAVVSGYMGGHVAHPSYQQVCNGNTGHAEVVQIHFDPAHISYDTLLDIFFAIHDPTTPNRQGNDIGTQYRSAVFFHSEQQQAAARNKLADLAGHWPVPIVTQTEPATTFWSAEDYHQNYFNQNPGQIYCTLVVAPKVSKALARFSAYLRD